MAGVFQLAYISNMTIEKREKEWKKRAGRFEMLWFSQLKDWARFCCCCCCCYYVHFIGCAVVNLINSAWKSHRKKIPGLFLHDYFGPQLASSPTMGFLKKKTFFGRVYSTSFAPIQTLNRVLKVAIVRSVSPQWLRLVALVWPLQTQNIFLFWWCLFELFHSDSDFELGLKIGKLPTHFGNFRPPITS